MTRTATAKRTPTRAKGTKKQPALKVAPPATASALDNMLSAPAPARAPTKSRTRKFDVPLSPLDKEAVDRGAAWRQLVKQTAGEFKVAECAVLDTVVEAWSDEFMALGKPPGMACLQGNTGHLEVSFSKLPNDRLTSDRINALAALGIDASVCLRTTGLMINVAAVNKLDRMAALKAALATVFTDEEITEVFQPVTDVDLSPLLSTFPQVVGEAAEQTGGDAQTIAREAVRLLYQPRITNPKYPGDGTDLVASLFPPPKKGKAR